MTTDDFLNEIILSQDVKEDDDEVKKLQDERKKVQDIVSEFYGDAKKMIRYGGSYAKDTMIKDDFDLDIICYFHADETAAGDTLKDIYNNLKETLEKKYHVDTKRSALRLKNKDSENDFHIDFVPGRFVEGKDGDAYLYQQGGEKDRLKTNPDKHIEHIKGSQLTDVIKLIKIWEYTQNINLKTFVLELLVIKILEDNKTKSLSEKLKIFFTKIKDGVENMAIEDPANPNNDLSEIFNQSTRSTLKSYAETASRNIENEDWEAIFNNRFTDSDENTEGEENTETSKSLVLMDISHCQLPYWPITQSPCSVKIRCFVKDNNDINKDELQSDGKTIPEHYKLEYKAEINNGPYGYNVYWQVVNTGYQAESQNGLRGNFFRGKDLMGDETPDQRINHEFTMYRGKHWIECFVVNNNILVARSGRFYVNILPTRKIAKRVQTPYWRRKY